jgi:hypothetical protein
MTCLSCPSCDGPVSRLALECPRCGHFQPEGRPRPGAAAVAHRTAGYFLEAATLFPLFRMTMSDGARPTWSESWVIVAALVVAAAALHWTAASATRRSPAARWRTG